MSQLSTKVGGEVVCKSQQHLRPWAVTTNCRRRREKDGESDEECIGTPEKVEKVEWWLMVEREGVGLVGILHHGKRNGS